MIVTESGTIARRLFSAQAEMEFVPLLAFVMDSARSIGKRNRVSALRNRVAFTFLFA